MKTSFAMKPSVLSYVSLTFTPSCATMFNLITLCRILYIAADAYMNPEASSDDVDDALR